MQVLVELIAGFIAMLAAVALAQFGVDLSPSRAPDREVHRVVDCGEGPSAGGQAMTVEVEQQTC